MKCVLMFFVATGVLVAQTKETIESLRALGRDSLISRATARLLQSDAGFDRTQYDRIRVIVRDDDILVRFEHSIAFYARNTAFKYRANVSLIKRSIGSTIVRNPDNYGEDKDVFEYFRWNDNARQAVKFVIDAVNRDSEIGGIPEGKMPVGTRMAIAEESGYYQISVDSWGTQSSYKIKQGSGKIYDASHRNSVRAQDDVEIELDR